MRAVPVIWAVCCLSVPAFGQSFNIDVGQPGTGPSSGYAAAGLAGVWNAIPVDHMTPFMTGPHPNDFMLVDIHGNLTGVGLHQYGGMDLTALSDPTISGNDAALMNDVLITHSAALETCVYLNGLQNGMYEIINYAWMPNRPAVMQRVRFDYNPGFEDVGGAWPGQHQEGVTYSKYIIEVTDGHVGLHIGIPPGGSTAIGAAWNGMQVRWLDKPQETPALSNGGGAALAIVLMCIGSWIILRRRSATVLVR